MPNRKQFVTFRVNGFLLGIDILMIREINQILDITDVPHAPPHVLGLVNLRGQTITVFDLGVRLGLGSRILTDDSHNVIFKYDAVGLLVDNIGDVARVDEEEIEPPPANTGGIGTEYIEGVVKLENELLLVLSTKKILEYASSRDEEKLADRRNR